MERYGIEWEQKGTHDKHLGVLDYKVQERAKEVAALEAEIATKRDEVKILSARIDNFNEGLEDLGKIAQVLDTDPAFQLPEPQGMMTAKSYKTRVAESLVERLKALVKHVLARCFEALDSYYRLNATNANLYHENENLNRINEHLRAENENLRSENRDYRQLRKVLGSKQISSLLSQEKKSKHRDKRFRNI